MELGEVLLAVCFFILGLALANLFFSYQKSREIEGNYTDCIKGFDGRWYRNASGDWVCINIYGMNYSRCVEVCQHECGHELFAEMCEKNKSKCQDILK